MIRKYGGSHRSAIEMTVGTYKRIAEFLSYFFKRRLTFLNDLSGNNVGINNWNTKLRELVSDSRFSAGYATGKPNSKRYVGFFVSHSEHQINVGVSYRLTPKHRDPASCRYIRTEGNWNTSIFALEYDQGDVDYYTDNSRHHNDDR